jgi:DNA-directed RNA polymerase specialized sigma subunit
MVMTPYHSRMTLDVESTRVLKIVHDQYVTAQEAAYDTREDLILTLRKAREAGATNQELGDVLGVTRQRISQLLKEDPSP